MQPTNDFKISYLFSTSEPEVPLAAPRPSHPRSLELPHAEDPSLVLQYRGQLAAHLAPPGEQIEAQFETEHGYLLFFSEREGSWFLSTLHVWYLPHDLSGADCLHVHMWDRGEDSRPAGLVDMLFSAHFEDVERGPPPLDGLVVENDHSLLFRVRARGWYRLSLFDSRPRRFKFSNFSVHHFNSQLWNERHIRARRFAPWEPVPPNAGDIDKVLDRQRLAERERKLDRARNAIPPAAIGVQRVRKLTAMEPIDDFERWDDSSSSRFGDFKDDEPPWLLVPPAIHPRLEAKLVASWERDYGRLMYRGHLIPSVRVQGRSIEAQFRTPYGYLLFFDPCEIYYIPADFSGAEWASVDKAADNRESLTVEVEDDSNVCFSVERGRWYRLSLFENPPRRGKRSDKSVWHLTSQIGRPRYFRILRHRRRPPL